VPGIVNGRAWLSERRRFLQEELAKDPADDQRAAIEAELASLDEEAGSKKHHWFSWLLGSRPPM
jgi:hypothetical protein